MVHIMQQYTVYKIYNTLNIFVYVVSCDHQHIAGGDTDLPLGIPQLSIEH